MQKVQKKTKFGKFQKFFKRPIRQKKVDISVIQEHDDEEAQEEETDNELPQRIRLNPSEFLPAVYDDLTSQKVQLVEFKATRKSVKQRAEI